MKILAFSLLLILSVSKSFSQQLTMETFPGSWKVVDCQLMPEVKNKLNTTEQKNMEQLRTELIGTIFNFETNQNFTIKFPNKTSAFTKELDFLNNKKWKFKDNGLVIGTEADNYSLMRIIIANKEGEVYFILEESPFILHLIKQ